MFPGQDRYYQWSSINYQRFAESFGIKTITIRSVTQINGALTKAFSGNGPYVIQVITDDREKAQKPLWIEIK
jgi:thiamine pyrophosphate-dependent acetolactate synthase large subunit-like protein